MSTQKPAQILIVEDNDMSRKLMCSILETKGYKVLTAIDGEDALRVIGENKIDLALVDLNMEPMGGFEFVQRLTLKSLKIPVAIITGDDASDVLVKANELGVVQLLKKPVEPERLIEIVAKILARYKR